MQPVRINSAKFENIIKLKLFFHQQQMHDCFKKSDECFRVHDTCSIIKRKCIYLQGIFVYSFFLEFKGENSWRLRMEVTTSEHHIKQSKYDILLKFPCCTLNCSFQKENRLPQELPIRFDLHRGLCLLISALKQGCQH